MKKKIVLVGAGHAHMATLSKLDKLIKLGHTVKVINPDPFYYYSGMGPGIISGQYSPEEIRLDVKKMSESKGAEFINGTVVKVDPEKSVLFLSNGTNIDYDIASFDIGSEVPKDFAGLSSGEIFFAKPVENLVKLKNRILNSLDKRTLRLIVIGGGAAGVEISLSIARLLRDNGKEPDITLISSDRLLHRFPEQAREKIILSLIENDVRITDRAAVIKLDYKLAYTGDGRTFPFDIIVFATGTKPSRIFMESGLPVGDDGGLKVNSFLQSVKYPNIFGGGDCIYFDPFPLDKVGVYAYKQNPVLYRNILAQAEGMHLKKFKPQKSYMQILNLGNNEGFLYRKPFMFKSKLALRIKNHIDRSFISKFK